MIGIKRVANGLEGDSTAFSYYYYNSTYMNKTILNDHMISLLHQQKHKKVNRVYAVTAPAYGFNAGRSCDALRRTFVQFA